ncbi:hypothetical protein C4D60_Mb00t00170 [Musa balbisiana]|uniref:Cytochrome c oxidase subunit 3 n=1 Tax=Musa balbisiana TaxID=52838 RepID=A0A4S8I8U6_MUSBA|nr:hypothetical protein C4D60_Mb00t00170 [Musa balbisiana]
MEDTTPLSRDTALNALTVIWPSSDEDHLTPNKHNVWWRDVLRESTLEGHHTKAVQLGPRYGSILFIVSEVMFLFAFFWASSHSSLAPTVEIGGIWPPKGYVPFCFFLGFFSFFFGTYGRDRRYLAP